MSDPLQTLFTLPILTDAIASGMVTAAVWWFYYESNIIKKGYNTVVGGTLIPQADKILRKPLEDLAKNNPKVFNQVADVATPMYKFFDQVGLVPKQYSGLVK